MKKIKNIKKIALFFLFLEHSFVVCLDETKKIPDVITSSVSINQVINASMLLSGSSIVNGQFEIAKSGRYSVASDLIANPQRNGKAVIYVGVSDVILDLGGKTLGLVPSATVLDAIGIELASGVRNIVICNGTISGYVGNKVTQGALAIGIKGNSGNANVSLENITITACYTAGLWFSNASNVRCKQVAIDGITQPTLMWPVIGSKYCAYFYQCRDIGIQLSMFNGASLPVAYGDGYKAVGLYLEQCSNVRAVDVSASSNSAQSTTGGSAYGVVVRGCKGCFFERLYAIGNTVSGLLPAEQECAGFLSDQATKGLVMTDCVANCNAHVGANAGVYLSTVTTQTTSTVYAQGNYPSQHVGMPSNNSFIPEGDVVYTTTWQHEDTAQSGQYPTVNTADLPLFSGHEYYSTYVTSTWNQTEIKSWWLSSRLTATRIDMRLTSSWIDTVLTATWLDSMVTYSSMQQSVAFWLPDLTTTTSVYGFRLTESVDSAVLTQCSAHYNEGGYTVHGFSCVDAQHIIFKQCSALGNVTYAARNNCSAYGFYSAFGSANQWNNCLSQGNCVGDNACSGNAQNAAGIVLHSEQNSSIRSSVFENNSAGQTGNAYGVLLSGECAKCSLQESQLITNRGNCSYGIKDMAIRSDILLRGNIAYGQGKVFATDGSVNDTGHMNYFLRYQDTTVAMNQLLREEASWNMCAIEQVSSAHTWYNISLAD